MKINNAKPWVIGLLIVIVFIGLMSSYGLKSFFSADSLKLSTFAIFILLAGIVFVYGHDPYRKDHSKILHPRTHATMLLLFLTVIAIILAIETVSVSTDSKSASPVEKVSEPTSSGEIDSESADNESAPPFIWMAFFIGTLGAALGALQRLDVSDAEANLLLENLGKIEQSEDKKVTILRTLIADESEKNQVIVDRDSSMKFHDRLVQQIYISVAIGGILGVFGLIVITALPEITKSLLPEFTDKNTATNLSKWLTLRPSDNVDYSLAVLFCIVFGYSQRLSKSVLNRLEHTAEELLGHDVKTDS